jgi:hypothetical protein
VSADEPLVGPIRDDVQSWDVEHCLAVYVPQTARALSLNRTAADVYLLSTGEYSIGDIVRLLAASYGVEESAIRADVVAAVDTLREEGVYADHPL